MKGKKLVAILLCMLAYVTTYAIDNKIYDYTLVKTDVSGLEVVDGVLTLTDKYGTKITFTGIDAEPTFSANKISDVSFIKVTSDNPCIVGVRVYAQENKTLTSSLAGSKFDSAFLSSSSQYLLNTTFIDSPTDYIRLSTAVNSTITVTAITIWYDVWARLICNGRMLALDNEEVMRNDRIIMRTFVEPSETVKYQYQVMGQGGNPLGDWQDTDADNGFYLSDYFATNDIDYNNEAYFHIKTKIIYMDGENEISYDNNGIWYTIYYIDEDRPNNVIPSVPTIIDSLMSDENNEVKITDEELTFTLCSDEGTTIWYKVSDPGALKVRARSAEIDESEYTDSQTNNKQLTVMSNCDLTYFSKHIESGLNSELSTIRFVKADSDEDVTGINHLYGERSTQFYDLSGRLLPQAPLKGIYIKVETNSPARIMK